MGFFVKAVHLLALGLWFGSVTFFSFFTALPIIQRMEHLTTAEESWVRRQMKEVPATDPQQAEQLQKRQGTRLAGEALDVIFARYFPLQAVCGGVALLTALAWVRRPGAVHKVRVAILALTLGLVLVNLFVLAPKVHELRAQRYSPDPAVAKPADEAFGPWHTYSLLTDMGTLLGVAAALVLGAALPAREAAASASGGFTSPRG
jgi:hypothetical protein